MEFVKGQKVKLEQLVTNKKLVLKTDINLINNNVDIDMCCFGVDKEDKLSDDKYFIFYNQLSSPEAAIKKFSDKNIFEIDFKLLPETIKKVVLCVTLDGNSTMKDVQNGSIKFTDGLKEVAEFQFTGKDYSSEKSIILCEIYEKDGIWRISIVASGFNGGLGDILRNYGGEESTETQANESINLNESTNNPSDTTKVNQPESLEKKVYLEKKEKVQNLVLQKAPHLIDLTKKVTVTLEKKKIEQIISNVVVVIDNSGSMYGQYSDGDVQRAMDKLLPIALMLDDNGELDAWAFASKTKHLSPITLDNIKDYLNNESKGWRKWRIGYGNNEPKIMNELIKQYKYNSSPVYVIFISDGGIYETRKIKELLIESANYPIFWQFVGIGGSNYGVLEELDEMEGRVVDNANFFSIDNIDSLSDEELYEELLNEFPQWLKEASAKGIVRR